MQKIKIILEKVLLNSSLEIKEIKPNQHLRDDLGLDSLALAELAVRIEDEFDLDVFEDGIVNTVQEILDKLQN